MDERLRFASNLGSADVTGLGLVASWFCAVLQASPATQIKLPDPKFKMEVFAEGLDTPRTLARADDGTVFVGTRSDKIYAIRLDEKERKAAEIKVLYSGLNAPNGVVVHKNTLYFAEIHQIYKVENVSWKTLNSVKLPKPFYTELLNNPHHGYRVLAVGPDEKLYFGLGVPCNVCVPPKNYGSLARISLDGKKFEIIAEGIRNSVGFDWDPVSKLLWFSDNGRDWLGDNLPPCELNQISKPGQHFGFPYCHGGMVADPEFSSSDPKACEKYEAPQVKLGAHVAPLGIHFYRGKQFPEHYRNALFVAEHGSWNRSAPVGYRIAVATFDSNRKVTKYEAFTEGWLARDRHVLARPVGFLELPDGSLLVTDDFGGKIFRISYAATP